MTAELSGLGRINSRPSRQSRESVPREPGEAPRRAEAFPCDAEDYDFIWVGDRPSDRLTYFQVRNRVGVYFSFFLGRSWLVWPHPFLRQFSARGGRRA